MSQKAPELSVSSVEVLKTIVEQSPWLRDNPLLVELQSRAAIGKKTYGVPLCTFNGRDVAQDEREEILDALAYAFQDALEASELKQFDREIKAWRRVAAYTNLLGSMWVTQ